MTKKAYISPVASVILFHSESLMTTTSLVQSDEEIGGSSALSNERDAWSSDNWTTTDED